MCLLIGRSEKALLRGRQGTLLGWHLDPKEPKPPKHQDHFPTYLPKCVYVQFQDEVDGKEVLPGWSIAGMGNGVYAIAPTPEYWYLDAKKSYSHMYANQAAPTSCCARIWQDCL